MENKLDNVQHIRDYMFGGKAEFTLHSLVTDKHFTYRVIEHNQKQDETVRFVFFLAGSNNDNDFSYAGTLKKKYGEYYHFNATKKSPNMSTPVMQAFGWFISRLNKDDIAEDQIEFLHSGTCSACGRKLTTPESIRIGMGPVCRSKL